MTETIKTLPKNTSITDFEAELWDLIGVRAEENQFRLNEVIGILELTKLRLYTKWGI